MSELISTSLSPEIVDDQLRVEEIGETIGKISVLEALAQPAQEDISPSMTWQSAWTGKEDR